MIWEELYFSPGAVVFDGNRLYDETPIDFRFILVSKSIKKNKWIRHRMINTMMGFIFTNKYIYKYMCPEYAHLCYQTGQKI